MNNFLQKLFIIVLVVAIIGIGVQLYKQLRQKYILKQELNEIEKKIYEFQINNENLKNKISSLKSEDYLKLELKEKFNLKEEGETVVVLKNNKIEDKNNNSITKNLKNNKIHKSNWEKWREVILGF